MPRFGSCRVEPAVPLLDRGLEGDAAQPTGWIVRRALVPDGQVVFPGTATGTPIAAPHMDYAKGVMSRSPRFALISQAEIVRRLDIERSGLVAVFHDRYVSRASDPGDRVTMTERDTEPRRHVHAHDG